MSVASVHADPATMAHAIRALAMDAVQQANSGHPGMPMGMAEIAVALWGRHLKHDPADPRWIDRDRFVLSNGHGSMLLYALLHLTGYDLPVDELRRFRQLHSRTPGHPEVDVTPGVETTTGPLGQGLANAVGMALAEKLLAAEFNRPGLDVVYAVSVSALVAVITEMVTQTAVLEEQVRLGFGQHPDAEIYASQPGLGPILGARVLAEFGDDPERYVDARARKNYGGMAPITKASGTRRVVLARYARNRHLADTLYLQAFSALSSSAGARAYYDRHRSAGATHHQALRTLANRLVGILHGCLRHRTIYDEHTAWAGQVMALTEIPH